ncbi:MAG TPA: molybdenum cofactor guanylyltransferase [Brevundimonas sp.]|uniref:molybdenum cofactor guanylyltransferase n=1 Tax=Brevundimonas sp. TaxID=1871086 RepID=UPI0026065758|nr:molybdenum cofactor guanylyltransferase [Brevundimonas sp.]HRO32092.1 molybdenum cofactor guanylyltransferase [Brevundimonas sp.]
MTLPVVILAGGQGRRIGGDKPRRRLGGRTLLDHALIRARGWSACIAVGVRSPEQAGIDGLRLLIDTPEIEGPLAGLAAALDWAVQQGGDRVLVVPCDMPFLPDDLAGRLAANLGPDDGVAVAASAGRLHPVCAVWRTSVRPLLDEVVGQGRLSLTALVERAGPVVVDWPVTHRDPFANINSSADLDLAERLMAPTATG